MVITYSSESSWTMQTGRQHANMYLTSMVRLTVTYSNDNGTGMRRVSDRSRAGRNATRLLVARQRSLCNGNTEDVALHDKTPSAMSATPIGLPNSFLMPCHLTNIFQLLRPASTSNLHNFSTVIEVILYKLFNPFSTIGEIQFRFWWVPGQNLVVVWELPGPFH
jgi:hypothetical protein